MILIADSGTTKTDWCVIDQNEYYKKIQTVGFNPTHQKFEYILNEIYETVKPQIKEVIDSIHFYGAGCTPANSRIIENALRSVFIKSSVSINSDLLGAARALCGENKGVACILGTGSNSCLFDGDKIIDQVPALGYILGDEGSGAVLGRIAISNYLKREFPPELEIAFRDTFDTNINEIIENVYRKNIPSRYLATFSKFWLENIEHPYCKNIIHDAFENFINRNVMKYKDIEKYNINFLGSIAFHYQNILNEIITEKGLILGKIIKDPIDELAKYHTKKQ